MGRTRYVCRDCNSKGKGGYFSVEEVKEVRCPYCGSKNVRSLS